ncbi:hypothetical protein PESP_a3512 [Pseudoalteromonas espejiana DSM 9414]|nr:hypothetical protein PESP_a3512 [Pseudoalteromonas espejiana DSM 9414]
MPAFTAVLADFYCLLSDNSGSGLFRSEMVHLTYRQAVYRLPKYSAYGSLPILIAYSEN